MPADLPEQSTGRIRVKFVLKSAQGLETANLIRRFPGGKPTWGKCDFILDYNATDYDWLVVYDDVPPNEEGRRVEKLSCLRQNTLLITAEPSSIKTYSSRFLKQFGHVLTSQEPWAIRHPNAIFSQPALLWFYGRTNEQGSFDHMAGLDGIPKTADVSTVCSSKQQRHTLHHTRYEFIQALKQNLPEMEIFGHGVRPITDKAEAVDPYRYHIAIENHVAQHHWTEKLADPLLGFSLPFYFGCPNAGDYIPKDSFIPITLDDPAATAAQIREAIRNDEWTKRLPAIKEARRRLLYELGIFPTLSRIIEAKHCSNKNHNNNGKILGRRALRTSNPIAFVTELFEQLEAKKRNRTVRTKA